MGQASTESDGMDGAAAMSDDTIDFAAAFGALAERQAPASSATMGGQSVRMLAFNGTGGWHKHDTAAETVIVWSGVFDVEYRDRIVRLQAGQCTVIAPGAEHRGVSEAGAQVVLLRAVEA